LLCRGNKSRFSTPISWTWDKYDDIRTISDSRRNILECGTKEISGSANAALEEPITLDELYFAIKQGKTKPPGEMEYAWKFISIRWRQLNWICWT
jgi:hypothetical protein